MLSIEDVRCFVAAYESGSSVAAADIAGTAQSNVSRRINRLEAQLRMKLFERHRRGMKPTRDGRRLYPTARRALQLFVRVEALGRR